MKKLLFTASLLGALLGSALIASAAVSTFRVVQTRPYNLVTGESTSATSIRITPVPLDLDGTKFTMTDFGNNPTVTVDPGLKGIEEIERFTGFTDNGDGTATLSGLSRDLTSKYPYTTTGTGRTHGAGAYVVFGNNPQIYGRLGAMENDNTWTGLQTFSSTTAAYPRVDVDPGAAFFTTAPGTVLVPLAQLARTALAGTVNASRTTQGLVQVAYRGQAASSTALGTTGAFAVLTTDIATSSPSIGFATSSVVMTRLDGRIAPIFLSTSTADTYSMGNINVVASTTLNGFISNSSSTVSGPLTVTATTTTTNLAIKGITAGQILYTDGNNQVKGTTTPSVTYSSGVTTKNTADADTTQTIAHGLTRTPTYIRFSAMQGNAAGGLSAGSIGSWNGTATSTVYSYQVPTSNGGAGTDTGAPIFLCTNDTGSCAAFVRGYVAWDGTNIYINWKKTGSTAGSYSILWEVQGMSQ